MLSVAKLGAGLGLSRQRIAYTTTIAILLFILWMGHRTHWHFGAAHHPWSAKGHQPNLHATPTDLKSAHNVVQATLDEDLLPVSDAAVAKAGIELGRVERRRMTTAIMASGVVAYNHNLRAELATRARGNVWRIEKHVGETIHKGDVLAIIEASEVGRAKGELLRAIVESELKATNFERVKQLGDTVAQRNVREAEAAARQALIQVQICVQALVNLGLPLSVAELQGLGDQQRANRVQFAGLPSSIVETLDAPTTTANLVPLIAPFDGVVIGRNLAIGEAVSPDQPHFEIADIRKVWVLLDVRKEDANQVRLGQLVSFIPDGYEGEVEGVIDWISTAMDEKTRTLQVRAEVANPLSPESSSSQPSHLLRAHTYGTGRILLRDIPEALVVPTDAVQLDGGRHFVFIREHDRFVRTAVEVGSREKNQIEIIRGLEDGMTIATAGSHVLKAEAQLVAATR